MDASTREPDVGMLIGQLGRALQEELFSRLAEQGHPQVRPRHGTVLAVLPAAGLRATELAQRSGQHKQIVGVIVDELERLGYDGYVGLEYNPTTETTEESLEWLPREMRGGDASVSDLRL